MVCRAIEKIALLRTEQRLWQISCPAKESGRSVGNCLAKPALQKLSACWINKKGGGISATARAETTISKNGESGPHRLGHLSPKSELWKKSILGVCVRSGVSSQECFLVKVFRPFT